MFRIGIIGAENSHATAFTETLNGYKPEHKEEFADFRVVAVSGHYPEANQALYDKYGLEMITDRPEEMLGKVDAVMVTARDGKYHAGFARPFIEAGLPAFVDKPFTSNPAEALALAKLAKEKGVPLVGGSSVKLTEAVLKLKALVDANPGKVVSGDVTAPVSLVNDYGNFWFYAAHLTECCLTIFGQHPEWVWANRTDKGVTVIVHYTDFDVTNHFIENVYDYTATVITTDGVSYSNISLDDIYLMEVRCFADMMRNGKMSHSYEELVAPVYLMDAIVKSFETGEKQMVGTFEV